MSKRILAILSVVALIAVVSISALAASGDVVWSLTKAEIDAYISSGQSSDYLMNSGDGASFAVADGDSLKFKGGRPNDYSVVDLKTKDLCEAGVEYTLVVDMVATAPTTLKLVETSGYTSLAEKTDATEAHFEYKFKDPKTNIRFQTNDGAVGFTIKSAVLYEGAPPAGGTTSGGTTTGNSKTGDTSIIFIAMGILALAACGAFVLSRKAKAE